MKKISLFCGVILTISTMLFVACGKDKVPTIGNYFTVGNATLVSDDMPEASSPNNIEVLMNENAIPGGSSYVSVVSEVPARKILVGMKDQVGYYEVPLSNNRDNAYSFIMTIDQHIDLGEGETSFSVLVAIVDENDEVSHIWESNVSLMTVGTGNLQVSLSFDNAKDVDLHLIEPEYLDMYGEPVSFYDRHIYYGIRVSAAGGELDLDSNVDCQIDNINNENITYNETAIVPSGTYKVYVDLFNNCNPEISTNYVVTVFYSGKLLVSKSGVFHSWAPSTENPINEEYVDNNDAFLTFEIQNEL